MPEILCNADCIEAMKQMAENSIDAIVTDPPYGLGFMGKEWDTFDKSQFGKAGEEGENDLKVKKNFEILPRYGDSKDLYAFSLEWAREAIRVLKPGGHLLSFAGSRTYHRMACAIEDAGFEIRDQIMWIYGSGFPKSMNIGKSLDKMQGNEREVIGERKADDIRANNLMHRATGVNDNSHTIQITKGTTEWEGWGTALKPAHEPLVLARKPLSEKTIAENCLKWGVGGLAIDNCRVGLNGEEPPGGSGKRVYKSNAFTEDKIYSENKTTSPLGRFPANVIHDGSDEVLERFPDNKGAFAPVKAGQKGFGGEIYGKYKSGGDDGKSFHGDGLGSAARFFYCAKAGKKERDAGCESIEPSEGIRSPAPRESEEVKTKVRTNNHPTVKPVALMRYLVTLISREGQTVLDPFMGSGTTGMACKEIKRNFIGIEKEKDYFAIAKNRIDKWTT
jgi:site-specific DNA-methyltransferase (adenine-specific)